MRRVFFAAALLCLATPTLAQVTTTFTAQQQDEIRDLVRTYLLEHPEILHEMLQELKQREGANTAAQQQELIASNLDALHNDANSPVIGNPAGDVVIVEFFDYNCGYCRKATQDVFDLVKSDGNIKYVLKELPIFGEDSRFAAKAALASAKQGKYDVFHYALMTSGVKIDKASTLAIAAQVGLDVAALEAEMANPVYDQMLDANYALAETLRIDGTPAFVIDDRFVPGWIPREEMDRLVAEARS